MSAPNMRDHFSDINGLNKIPHMGLEQKTQGYFVTPHAADPLPLREMFASERDATDQSRTCQFSMVPGPRGEGDIRCQMTDSEGHILGRSDTLRATRFPDGSTIYEARFPGGGESSDGVKLTQMADGHLTGTAELKGHRYGASGLENMTALDQINPVASEILARSQMAPVQQFALAQAPGMALS